MERQREGSGGRRTADGSSCRSVIGLLALALFWSADDGVFFIKSAAATHPAFSSSSLRTKQQPPTQQHSMMEEEKGHEEFRERVLLLDEATTFLTLSGSSGMEEDEEEEDDDDEDGVFTVQPPLIQTGQMASALRWTVEVNQRLEWGTTFVPDQRRYPAMMIPGVAGGVGGGGTVDSLRGGGVEATATYRLPQTLRNDKTVVGLENEVGENNIALFHAKENARNRQQHSWDPDLSVFLRHLWNDDVRVNDKDCTTTTITTTTPDNKDHDAFLERTLAMIYLDRACSVETIRSKDSQRLPFCTPTTVHRLVLASVMLAVNAVRGDSATRAIQKRVEAKFGIPADISQAMVECMRSALGEKSIFVTPDELLEWKLQWEARFE